MLRFYLEVARTAFRRQLVYRWANLAGLATNIFFGVIVSYVYIALFQANGQAHAEVNGFTLHDTLRYIWLVQALIMVVLPFGWFDLMLTIRSGEVVSDLSKPSDFFWYWFSRESGRNVYYLLFRCIPTYLAGMLLFGIGAPTELGPLAAVRREPLLRGGARCRLPLPLQHHRLLGGGGAGGGRLRAGDRALLRRQLRAGRLLSALAARSSTPSCPLARCSTSRRRSSPAR